MVVIAQGFAWDAETRSHSKLVTYEARDRMEAIRWMNFQREWLTNLKIVEPGK